MLLTADHRALETLLEEMRAVRAELDMLPAGIALLHLEAAVAALESRLHSRTPTAWTVPRERPLHAAR